MLHSTAYDVVVVGAGPAGSFMAYLLASASSLKVLIIDKDNLPRYKPCGGGLTRRAVNLLPFDLTPVIEDQARQARVSVGNLPVYEQSFAEPIFALVMRDRLDAFLLQQACRAGCDCLSGVRFNGLEHRSQGVCVLTSAGRFEAGVLVGADGAVGATAGALGLKIDCNRFYAIEGEVDCRSGKLQRSFKGTVHFDFGIVPGGYGWIFPKKDHLSVGLLTSAKHRRRLKTGFRSYLERKQIGSNARLLRLSGYTIPWGTGRKSVFANQKGLLVGDAAGLTDPISGEGIFHAFQQAQLAAPVVIDHFRHPGFGLQRYQQRMRRTYRREMLHACGMSHFLYGCERLSHPVLRRSGSLLAEQFLNIAAGRITYPELSAKLLRPAKLLQLLRTA